jgi:hypothetical protein
MGKAALAGGKVYVGRRVSQGLKEQTYGVFFQIRAYEYWLRCGRPSWHLLRAIVSWSCRIELDESQDVLF